MNAAIENFRKGMLALGCSNQQAEEEIIHLVAAELVNRRRALEDNLKDYLKALADDELLDFGALAASGAGEEGGAR